MKEAVRDVSSEAVTPSIIVAHVQCFMQFPPPFYCREWVYAFLVDPEDRTMVSTGIQLSYSCITESSNSHIFHQIVSIKSAKGFGVFEGGEST